MPMAEISKPLGQTRNDFSSVELVEVAGHQDGFYSRGWR